MVPSYIQTLRKHIGHDLLLIPSVTGAVTRSDGKLLMLKHSETGTWVFPGGALEPGERPADAVSREIQEETGISAQVTGLIGVYAGPEFEVTYKNGDQTAYMMALYGCEVGGNEVLSPGDEAADIGFFPANSLEELPLSAWVHVLLGDVLAWLNTYRVS